MINGLIVDMNENSIYEGIKKLIEDSELMNKFNNNLINENLGTENEIQKVYELIES